MACKPLFFVIVMMLLQVSFCGAAAITHGTGGVSRRNALAIQMIGIRDPRLHLKHAKFCLWLLEQEMITKRSAGILALIARDILREVESQRSDDRAAAKASSLLDDLEE